MDSDLKKVAILQSNYIPWKGYFDLIHDVDEFIFYDDVQYTTRDWRNRNRVKTPSGLTWLSVPVGASTQRLTKDVIIPDSKWQLKHWKTITHNYNKSIFFNKYKSFFEHVYLEKKWSYLVELNRYLIINISKEFLGIKTNFNFSENFSAPGKKSERLLHILKQACSQIYYSGPAAKDYINEDEFKNNGINIIWKDYSNYPIYKQLHSHFYHEVSIIDLLFNTGENAPYYIWEWRKNKVL